MRLLITPLLSVFDLKTWGLLCVMVALLAIVELACILYQQHAGLSAYIMVTGMFFCCFYSQGALAGMLIARMITLDKDEGEAQNKC